jgi:hypothetical protein
VICEDVILCRIPYPHGKDQPGPRLVMIAHVSIRTLGKIVFRKVWVDFIAVVVVNIAVVVLVLAIVFIVIIAVVCCCFCWCNCY